MKLYEDKSVIVFFGDRSTCIDPSLVRGQFFKTLVEQAPFKEICDFLPFEVKTLITAHQTHGTSGFTITNSSNLPFFTQEGDYLLTDLPEIALAVATADCLPVVLYDPVKKVAVVVHAGWRGLVGGVVEQALKNLLILKGSVITDIRCLVGPAAQVCCYEVSQDFCEQARCIYPDRQKLLQKTIQKIDDKFFFDTQSFLREILLERGFLEGFFGTSYSECTICKGDYCSYRREKMSPLRQLTVVSLK